MNTKTKVILTTLLCGLPATVLSAGTPVGTPLWKALWPFEGSAHGDPSSAQVPFFILIAVIEGLAFGLAVSFLCFGRKTAEARFGAGSAFSLSIFWLLGSWWIHDSVHQTNGFNFSGLLAIEYVFHVTLIAAGAYVAWVLVRPTSYPMHKST